MLTEETIIQEYPPYDEVSIRTYLSIIRIKLGKLKLSVKRVAVPNVPIEIPTGGRTS